MKEEELRQDVEVDYQEIESTDLRSEEKMKNHHGWNEDNTYVHIKTGKDKSIKYETEFAPARIFWGVLLLIGAAALVLGQMGYLGDVLKGISVWDILLTIFFVVTLLEGILKIRIGEALFSIAFLIIVHDELLGLEAITPWPVLGAALLGTIGLKMIFPKAGKKHGAKVVINGVAKEKGICEETRKGNSISYENVFSSAVKYVAGEFSNVDVENAFGSMQVYFTDALPAGGSASVNVQSAFGSVVLYVPSSWKVVCKTEHIFGSTGEKGQCNLDGENVLYISGEAVFGSFQIKYI